MWALIVLIGFEMSSWALPILAAPDERPTGEKEQSHCVSSLLEGITETLTYPISYYSPPGDPSRIANFWKDGEGIHKLFRSLKNRVQAPTQGPVANPSVNFLAQNFHGHATVNAIEGIYEAMDYGWLSPDDGRISITYGLRAKNGARFYLEIADNGAGITLASLALMAERRCGTTKKDPWQFPGGEGLGVCAYCLSEIKKEGDRCLIETHRDGLSYRLEISSSGSRLTSLPKSEKKGTVFRFEIPLEEHDFDFKGESRKSTDST